MYWVPINEMILYRSSRLSYYIVQSRKKEAWTYGYGNILFKLNSCKYGDNECSKSNHWTFTVFCQATIERGRPIWVISTLDHCTPREPLSSITDQVNVKDCTCDFCMLNSRRVNQMQLASAAVSPFRQSFGDMLIDSLWPLGLCMSWHYSWW